MSEKIAVNKGNQAKAQTAPEAVTAGETAPKIPAAQAADLKGHLEAVVDAHTEALTPRQQAALDHTRDADMDGNYLTANIIDDLSKSLATDEEYEGEVFTLADFDELVKRGLLQVVYGEYHLTLTAMDLSPAETAFIRATRASDWAGAGKAMSDLMDVNAGKKLPSKPPVELISFRAPDPAQAYGYDYGNSIMPHELIAMAIVYDLARFTDLPRYYTVADGERSADFLETIIGAIETAFQTIEAIELAQLIVAIQRDKSRNE